MQTNYYNNIEQKRYNITLPDRLLAQQPLPNPPITIYFCLFSSASLCLPSPVPFILHQTLSLNERRSEAASFGRFFIPAQNHFYPSPILRHLTPETRHAIQLPPLIPFFSYLGWKVAQVGRSCDPKFSTASHYGKGRTRCPKGPSDRPPSLTMAGIPL